MNIFQVSAGITVKIITEPTSNGNFTGSYTAVPTEQYQLINGTMMRRFINCVGSPFTEVWLCDCPKLTTEEIEKIEKINKLNALLIA